MTSGLNDAVLCGDSPSYFDEYLRGISERWEGTSGW